MRSGDIGCFNVIINHNKYDNEKYNHHYCQTNNHTKNKIRKQNGNQNAHRFSHVKKYFSASFVLKYTSSDMGWQRILLVNC